MSQDEKHPIAAGLIALVAVAVAVGLIIGVVTLAATHVLGIGGDSAKRSSGAGASLYLPTPSPTDTPSGPLVTLTPDETESAEPSEGASSKPEKTKKPEKKITLQAGELSVSPMQQIDLTGVYPGGEGAILRVQRQSGNGPWEDFPVPDLAVSGGQFSTYVQTSRPGVQKFRMKDIDSGAFSNVVKVTIR
ncbi:hypothetical protein [Nocardioides sp. KR10-350]|uniref:hypothetical protein n=1 Tax=Nocardioides cheoyonin TaxID=3156615 RepID=UPI0032B4E242